MLDDRRHVKVHAGSRQQPCLLACVLVRGSDRHAFMYVLRSKRALLLRCAGLIALCAVLIFLCCAVRLLVMSRSDRHPRSILSLLLCARLIADYPVLYCCRACVISRILNQLIC